MENAERSKLELVHWAVLAMIITIPFLWGYSIGFSRGVEQSLEAPVKVTCEPK